MGGVRRCVGVHPYVPVWRPAVNVGFLLWLSTLSFEMEALIEPGGYHLATLADCGIPPSLPFSPEITGGYHHGKLFTGVGWGGEAKRWGWKRSVLQALMLSQRTPCHGSHLSDSKRCCFNHVFLMLLFSGSLGYNHKQTCNPMSHKQWGYPQFISSKEHWCGA